MENSTTVKNAFLSVKNPQNVAIVVGSEGGFTEKECKLISNAGAKSVTLGKRIMRVETATICTTSVVMYELGELN